MKGKNKGLREFEESNCIIKKKGKKKRRKETKEKRNSSLVGKPASIGPRAAKSRADGKTNQKIR